MYKQAIIKQLLKRAGTKERIGKVLHKLSDITYPGDSLGDHIRGTQGDIAQALAVSELAKALGSGKISNVGAATLGAGSVALSHLTGGMLANADPNAPKLEWIDSDHKHPSKFFSYVPGAATFNDVRRQRALEHYFDPYSDGKGMSTIETLGQVTAPLTTGLLGSGISGATAKLLQKAYPDKDISARRAALSGGVAGTGLGILGNLGGLIAAQFTKGRTEDEQRKYYNSTLAALGNTFIPGVASYNRAKSIGLADRLASALAKAKELKDDGKSNAAPKSENKTKSKRKSKPVSIYM